MAKNHKSNVNIESAADAVIALGGQTAVARLMGMSASRVDNWISKNEIPMLPLINGDSPAVIVYRALRRRGFNVSAATLRLPAEMDTIPVQKLIQSEPVAA